MSELRDLFSRDCVCSAAHQSSTRDRLQSDLAVISISVRVNSCLRIKGGREISGCMEADVKSLKQSSQLLNIDKL